MVRKEANAFSRENRELHTSITRLTGQVDTLKKVEAEFITLMEQQGSSVEECTKLLRENHEIMVEMQARLEAQVVQDLLRVVIDSDRNNDFVIDPTEADMLILRLSHTSKAGVTFNKDAFRKKLKEGGYNLDAVIDICRDLMNNKMEPGEEENDEGDQVVVINTRELCFPTHSEKRSWLPF
mmetsp:Transcript_27202/g.41755  ORF Transcript_27202/g.41755 Transcript_27202/m.41755 type:complete len:181 (+) Transcript_27202:144-686(+)|eukprot:CAMPEP_0118702564 /NCGR_PEP_ID=MMETSP0800-20121206/17966_1 /TAXON_ID=210618 ORGANISM="Striatella unipunctata, Strain CCMP2910" /NCGR_SAMPLE_ID=MMETSP0800 /ASSEMBLY_ACC=CAM_ASM_000638 /LENGTH=180 /DNA_ID=CAMNT_0006603789 /DNA_START=278 /DNA_END=820 /DNA_ORIENTATION=+